MSKKAPKKSKNKFDPIMGAISPLNTYYMTYGIYAVFCQTVFICLSFSLLYEEGWSLPLLSHICRQYIEYPIMSLALLIIGALLIEICEKYTD